MDIWEAVLKSIAGEYFKLGRWLKGTFTCQAEARTLPENIQSFSIAGMNVTWK